MGGRIGDSTERKDSCYTNPGVAEARKSPTIQREIAYAIHTRADRWRKIAYNIWRKGRGCTNQGVDRGGGSVTIQRGNAEAIRNNGWQKGADQRHYKEGR